MTSKYPMADWLDGRVWLLRVTLDYTCMAMSMQSMVYTAAKAAGVKVATQLVDYGGDWNNALLVQAYPADCTWKPNLANIPWNKIKKAMDNPR